MTAARLYEIVKDVDRSIWPGEVDIDDLRNNSSWWESGRVDGVSDALAEAAFVGAMVRYLQRKGYKVEIDVDDTIWLTGPYPTETRRHIKTGPTLIEALAAACKEAK